MNFDSLSESQPNEPIGHQQPPFEQFNTQANYYSPNAQMQPQHSTGMQHFGSVSEQLNEVRLNCKRAGWSFAFNKRLPKTIAF